MPIKQSSTKSTAAISCLVGGHNHCAQNFLRTLKEVPMKVWTEMNILAILKWQMAHLRMFRRRDWRLMMEQPPILLITNINGDTARFVHPLLKRATMWNIGIKLP